MGGKFKQLRPLLTNKAFQFFYSAEILTEFKDVSTRPSLSKYISEESAVETLTIIEESVQLHHIKTSVQLLRDSKDDFLLALAEEVNADFLVSGDKDVLALQQYKNTKILNFTAFIEELNAL